jgi:hypothetical protein
MVSNVNDFMKKIEKSKHVYNDTAQLESEFLRQLDRFHYDDQFLAKNGGQAPIRYKSSCGEKYVNIGCTQKGCKYKYWFKFEGKGANAHEI